MADNKEDISIVRERLDTLKEEFDLKRKIGANDTELRGLIDGIIEARKEYNKLLSQDLSLAKMSNEELKKKYDLLRQLSGTQKEENDILLETYRRQTREVEKQLEAAMENEQADIEQIKNLQKQLGILEKQEKVYKNILEDVEKTSENFAGFAAKSGVALKSTGDSFISSASKSLGVALGKVNIDLKKIGTSFTNIFSNVSLDSLKKIFSNVGSFLSNALISSFSVLEKLSSMWLEKLEERLSNLIKVMTEKAPEFGKATGLEVSVFRDQIEGLAGDYAQYGFAVERVDDAIRQAAESTSIFSKLSQEQRTELVKSSLAAQNFGISLQESAKIQEDLSTVLGKTVSQSAQTYNYLQRVALGAEIQPAKLAKDLESALPKLAAQGDKMIEVFAGLSREAKKLNVEVNDLLGLVDKFDTFEGAAESAGKLNAILGSDYLNSLQMINASEEERVLLIRNAIDQAGLQFDTLNKYEKLSIANALGLQDISKASKILSGDYNDLQSSLLGTSISQEQYNKRAEANAQLTEKLNTLFDKFAPLATKVAEGLTFVVDVFASMSNGIFYTITAFASLISIIGAYMLTRKALKLLADSDMLGIKAIGRDVSAIRGTVAPTDLSSAGKAATDAGRIEKVGPKGPTAGSSIRTFLSNLAQGFKKFGQPDVLKGAGAFALLAVSLAGSLYLISLSIENFNKATYGGVAAMLVTMTALMIGVTQMVTTIGGLTAGPQAAIVALGIGIMLSIGAAMLAFGKSIEMISDSLVKLKDVNIAQVSGLMLSLSALSTFGMLGILSSAGIYLISKSLNSLVDVLKNIPDPASLSGLINGLVSLSNISITTNFNDLATGIDTVMASLNKIQDAEVALKVSYAVNEIANIPTLEDEKIVGVERVLKAVSDYQVTVANAKVDVEGQRKFLEQISNVMSAAVGLINAKQPVNIKIEQKGSSFNVGTQ